MKRMSPTERKQKVSQVINNLHHDWTCRYGKWNRDKMILEIEKHLRERRLDKK